MCICSNFFLMTNAKKGYPWGVTLYVHRVWCSIFKNARRVVIIFSLLQCNTRHLSLIVLFLPGMVYHPDIYKQKKGRNKRLHTRGFKVSYEYKRKNGTRTL